MRKLGRTKKLLSILLAVVMVLSNVPVHAWAEDDCTHHKHDTTCGYVEAVEGKDCTHQCAEACKEEVTDCIHTHKEEDGCVYTPAVEAVACDHVCSTEICGYVTAQEEVACVCNAQPQHSEECASAVTEGAECDCTPTLTHAEGCEPKAAVEGVPCGHEHGECAYQEAANESWSCDHTCTLDNGCITEKEKCTHVCPEGDCGFVKAVEGSPCTYVCEECLNEDVCPHCKSTGGAHGENCPEAVCPHCGNLNKAHSDTCSTRCTNAEGCIDGNHGIQCPLYLCDVCGKNVCICEQVNPVDEEPELNSIVVTTFPDKTEYTYGEELNVAGGKLTLTYSDETTEEIDLTAQMVSGYSSTTIGEQLLTVTYEEKTAVFAVTVVKQQLPLYYYGESDLKISQSQEIEYAFFTKGADGSGMVPGAELNAAGVAYIKEVVGSDAIWLAFSGVGSGTVTYETDTAVYTLNITTVEEDNRHICENTGPHLFLVHTDGVTIYHSLELEPDSGMPGTLYFRNAAGKEAALNYDDVTFTGVAELISNQDFVGINAKEAGEGSVEYSANGMTYSLAVTGLDSSGNGCEYSCSNANAHLFYYFTEHGQAQHEKLILSPGDNRKCTLGFYDGQGNTTLLTHADFTFPSFMTSLYNSENIGATGVGEGNFTYIVGETTYTLAVSSTLPDYGIYSDPQRTAEKYMAKIPANPGADKTVYLMWDANATEADTIEIEVNGSVYGKRDFEKVTENSVTYIKINFQIPDANWIGFRVKDANGNQLKYFEVERTKGSGGGGGGTSSQYPGTVNLEINGSLVTVGLAAVMGPEADLMILNSGGAAKWSFDPNHPNEPVNMRLCVGAMVNFGDKENEAIASQSVHNQILQTAEIILKKWENYDGSDPSIPNLALSEPVEKTVSGVNTKMVTITAEPRATGMCRIVLKFTYEGQNYETFYTVTYSDPDMSVNVSEDADLATILSSSQNLIAWLQQEHAGALKAYEGDGFVNLNLPAKTYEDTITVNIDNQAFSRIRLRGSTDGSGRTIMRKLVVKQGIFTVDDIDFVRGNSGADVAIEHNNENRNYHSTIGTIGGCSIQGYPVGVKDIGYGHIRYISDSLIYNCNTGVVIHPETDGAGDNGGTIEYHGNVFMNSDTAISLESLPNGITAYRTQFNDNTFLFCDLEFNMVPTGTFYFLRNYFGGHERGGEKYEDWKHPGNKKDEQIRHHARIQEANKSGTKTVTNPVRKTIETPCDFWIYTGEDQHTAIFNAEAGRILVDGDTFNNSTAVVSDDNASSTDIPVSIVDNNGNEIAKWTF